MNFLEKAQSDPLFLRMLSFLWGIPFGGAFIWMGLWTDFYPDNYKLLILEISIFLIFSLFMYTAFSKSRMLDISQVRDSYFWILFTLSSLIIFPLWKAVRSIYPPK